MAEIDHIVIGARTLAEGAAFIEEHLGVLPDKGGTHEGVGTHNMLLGLGPAPRPAKGQLRWFVPWFREEQAWDFQAVHVALAKRFPLLVAVSDTSEGASGGTTFDLYRDGKLTLSLGRRCVFEGELKLPMAKRAKLSDH